MPCASPCKNCDRQGLPILFTRYAAAYSAQAQGMAALKPLSPTGHLQARPGGVAMKTARYNLRMLRAGYLYVHIERDAAICADDEWKGYAVHPHGYLSEFPVNLPDQARAQPACEVEIRGANASLVWVRDAGRVKKLWYMFHPDLLDYEHLKSKIETQPAQCMQSFDVAGWARGNLAQENTTQPGQLNGQVVEFSALTSAAVRNAMEPQMYGLMGSNAQERAWGDYEEPVEETRWSADALGNPVPEKVRLVVARKGHTYQSAHGARLRKMAECLQGKKGAVVACEDAIGIAQELGHLQVEAQVLYTAWQKSQAPGCSQGVTNEWAFQTVVGARGLVELVQKGAVARVETGFEESARIHAPLPYQPQDAAVEQARRTHAREANRKLALTRTAASIKAAYTRFFDQTVAGKIVAMQDENHKKSETDKSNLCADQIAWLNAKALERAVGRFSAQDSRAGQLGGGGALTAQLAQCMAGTEGNANGQAWLHRQDLAGNGLLAKTLCFNNITLKGTWQELTATQPAPFELPKPDASTPGADGVLDKARLLGARAGLGDKALGLQDGLREAKFGQAVAAIFASLAGKVGLADEALRFLSQMNTSSASGALRKAAWPLHVASLLSVKMMQALKGLPVTRVEATIVRYTALTGLISLGKTAQAHALLMKLPLNDQDALLQARRKIADAAHAIDAHAPAANARAAGFAALLDLGQAVLKGRQLALKGDARTASEMVGNLLQGIGAITDWRAKAYEETVYKGVRALDLATATAEEVGAMWTLQDLQLSKLRLTAFKFLLPAAMVSGFWDGMDALQSDARGNKWLARAQWASAAGTAFAITSTLMTASGAVLGISASTWAVTAAFLGLVGAALTLAAVAAVLLLKEDEWMNWLRDSPLNIERKGSPPIHKSLRDTLQQLANAKAAAT